MGTGNSLVVQWLGLCAFTAKGTGSVPVWRTKIPQVWPKKKKKDKNIWVLIKVPWERKSECISVLQFIV